MFSRPHLFVHYQQGMFGTMLCVILTQRDINFVGDGRGPNAHHSGFHKQDSFHSTQDYKEIMEKSPEQIKKFFRRILDTRTTGIKNNTYNLSSYSFLNFPFHNFFKDYHTIILKPENKDSLIHWSERYISMFAETDNPDVEILQRERLMQKQHRRFPYGYETSQIKNAIYFDPINFFDYDKTQKFIDKVCSITKMENIKIPKKKYVEFMEKNQSFFDKMSK